MSEIVTRGKVVNVCSKIGFGTYFYDYFAPGSRFDIKIAKRSTDFDWLRHFLIKN